MDRLSTYRKRRNSLSNNCTPHRAMTDRCVNHVDCTISSNGNSMESPPPSVTVFVDTENQTRQSTDDGEELRSPSLCQITEIKPAAASAATPIPVHCVLSSSPIPVASVAISSRMYDVAAEHICLRIALLDGEKQHREAVQSEWLWQLLDISAKATHSAYALASEIARKQQQQAAKREADIVATATATAVQRACGELRSQLDAEHAASRRKFLLQLLRQSGLDESECDYFVAAGEEVTLAEIEGALSANITELRAAALLHDGEEEKNQQQREQVLPPEIQSATVVLELDAEVAKQDAATSPKPELPQQQQQQQQQLQAQEIAPTVVNIIASGGTLSSAVSVAQAATAMLQKAAVEEKLRRASIQLDRAVQLLARNQARSSAFVNWQRKVAIENSKRLRQRSAVSPVGASSWLAGAL